MSAASGGRVVVATGNPGKLREFRAALEAAGLAVDGLDALDDGPEVEETGSSFEENARLKAEAYSRRTDRTVLADDSGIVVDALGGEPGVLSARYGGPGLDDAVRVRFLLKNLEPVPEPMRTARFVCALAVARAGATLEVYEGSVEGLITREPAGDEGFGYDPVFFHEPIGRTFAEIPRDRKQGLSHRGAAIRAFLAALADGSIEV